VRSEEFDNASWAINEATITANQIVAPNGTTTADLLTTSATTGVEHYILQSFTVAASTAYTASVYAKAGTGSTFDLQYRVSSAWAGGNVLVSFNLSTQVVTITSGTATASITPVGNGWFRCQITATSSVAGGSPQFRIATGDGSGTVFLWGAQLETGTFPTSYIPTTSATVTRAADLSSSTTTSVFESSWYNQTEGTVFAEVAVAQPNTGGNQFVFRTSDNGYNNAIAINIPGQAQLSTASGGTFDGSASSVASLVANVSAKIGAAYATNNLGISLNGATAVTDASATMPTGLNRADIGSDHAGSNRVKAGTIKRLTYWPTRMVNTVLQQITQ
jgi:hypothetical protein